jgi:ficolin
MAFSTKDRDNDVGSQHCAQQFHSGWWFEKCYDGNVNGLYVNESRSAAGECGVEWTIGQYCHSFKAAEMKIRPSNF